MTLPSRIPLLGLFVRRAICTTGLCRLIKSPKAAGMVEYGGTYPGAYLLRRGLFMPWELEQVLARETVREGLRRLGPLTPVRAAITPRPRSSFAKVAALESSLYMRNQLLRDTDWASMAHSLEVRVPLVDARLLKATAPLMLRQPDSPAKANLAQSPRVPLPAAVTTRAKTGFTTPIVKWLQADAALDRYAEVPSLAAPECHWSRRWAYGVTAN
jgi:asparagine synthase (glutamine-hydrolysing)